MKPSKTRLKHLISPFAMLSALLFIVPVSAGETVHSSHVIKVATGDSEIVEVDVSDMELGESRTFVTETGKTIDLLKGPEGVELYIDGELFEPGFDRAQLDALSMSSELVDIHETLEAVIDEVGMAGEDMQVIIAQHRIEETCDVEGDCDVQVWIDEDRDVTIDVDADALHEGDREIIVIRKEKHAELQ